jgi:hypothetical protein
MDSELMYAHLWQVAVSAEEYDAIFAALGDAPPDGLIMHLASPNGSGMRIIEVWRSAEHSARCAGRTLAPVVADQAERLPGELPAGEREVLPVHRLWLAAPDPAAPAAPHASI